jgi:hypothetical protein
MKSIRGGEMNENAIGTVVVGAGRDYPDHLRESGSSVPRCLRERGIYFIVLLTEL